MDGAKVAGFIDVGAGGSLEYAAYGGWKQIDEDSGTADALRGIGSATASSGLGDDLEIERAVAYGAMLHWHTPLQGLGLRVSGATLRDFEATGRQPGPIPGSTVTSVLEVDSYPLLVLSAEYEVGAWLLAAEYGRYFADGSVTSTIDLPFPPEERDFTDDHEGWYVSATWHARPRLDLYAAIDVQTDDPGDYSTPEAIHRAYVLAARYSLRENWLIKAEFNLVEGTNLVRSGEGGGEPEDDWWLVAFKTTVDF